jgi:hydroxymethylglutaryl-CoA reductase (NADPH)
MRGNIENPVGAVQVPLGVAGPLHVEGEHAQGLFYVPLATTEGALVRSYERGMMALTRAGGATVRLHADENRVSPVFVFDGVAEATAFARELPGLFESLKAEAESTTRHGRLLRLEPRAVGREVAVHFVYWTADAHGMNMIVKATDHACRWLVEQGRAGHAGRYYLFSGAESEKRASGSLFAGGKGKKVVAGARLSRRLVRAYLHTTPAGFADLWQRTVIGHLQSGALGYNGHFANGLTALFIACGQDVANVVNSAVGITSFEVLPDGDLYASVTLPALTVATVGGGTGLGTARECLEMLGCVGEGAAPKLAEIVAATLLAGELSMGAAIASGEFVDAHEEYGRNRPSGNG